MLAGGANGLMLELVSKLVTDEIGGGGLNGCGGELKFVQHAVEGC